MKSVPRTTSGTVVAIRLRLRSPMARRSSFDDRTRPRRTKPSTASSSDAPPRPSATITIAQFVREGVETGRQHPDQRDQHPERDQRQVDGAHDAARLRPSRELPGRGEHEGHVGRDHDVEKDGRQELAECRRREYHVHNLVLSAFEAATPPPA